MALGVSESDEDHVDERKDQRHMYDWCDVYLNREEGGIAGVQGLVSSVSDA